MAFREPDEQPTASTAAHLVAHEAPLRLLAQRAGVRVPPLVSTAAMADGEHLLVRGWVDGRALAGLATNEITTTVLTDVWDQVGALHRAGIAHGAMRADHVIVDGQCQCWLVELGAGTASASARDRAGDVAELLASLAASVPAEQVVASAARALGPEAVADAVALLQPLALSVATRRRMTSRAGTLASVRAEAARIGHVAVPALQTPTRPTFMPGGLGFAT